MLARRRWTAFALIALLLCWLLVAPEHEVVAVDLVPLVFAGFVLAELAFRQHEEPRLPRIVLLRSAFAPRPPPVGCL